jgi:hypothetical protein
MVAVGFNPRFANRDHSHASRSDAMMPGRRDASARRLRWKIHELHASLRDAPNDRRHPVRGLKPTATVIVSLRDENRRARCQHVGCVRDAPRSTSTADNHETHKIHERDSWRRFSCVSRISWFKIHDVFRGFSGPLLVGFFVLTGLSLPAALLIRFRTTNSVLVPAVRCDGGTFFCGSPTRLAVQAMVRRSPVNS